MRAGALWNPPGWILHSEIADKTMSAIPEFKITPGGFQGALAGMSRLTTHVLTVSTAHVFCTVQLAPVQKLLSMLGVTCLFTKPKCCRTWYGPSLLDERELDRANRMRCGHGSNVCLKPPCARRSSLEAAQRDVSFRKSRDLGHTPNSRAFY